MKSKKGFPIDNQIEILARKVIQLEIVFDKLIIPRKWWEQKISIGELLSLVGILSEERTHLWKTVYERYPELLGNLLSIDLIKREITIINEK